MATTEQPSAYIGQPMRPQGGPRAHHRARALRRRHHRARDALGAHRPQPVRPRAHQRRRRLEGPRHGRLRGGVQRQRPRERVGGAPRLRVAGDGRHQDERALAAREGQGAPRRRRRRRGRRDEPRARQGRRGARQVDWEPLPAVTDPLEAMEDGAPLVHDDSAPTCRASGGSRGDSPAPARRRSAFFDDPDLVKVKMRHRLRRLIPNAMEPRGVVVDPNVAMGEFTMYTASQIPHIVRTTQAVTCGIAEAKLRVVAPDVGGGFGSKLETYAEESICLALARRLNTPIKWTEERSEGYLATIHGRDLYTDMEMAATRDGVLKAVRVNVWCPSGAYQQIVTPGIQMLSAWLYGGLYDIEGYDFEYTNIFTHTTPTDAYRGAGRPEATYAVERTLDHLARELGMDPAEIRRKNYIPTEELPNFTIAAGLTVRLGRLPADPRRDDEGRRLRRRAPPAEGAPGERGHQAIGIGLRTWTEMCGLAPSRVLAALKYVAGGWEAATIEMLPTGTVQVVIGVTPHGQGHVTTFVARSWPTSSAWPSRTSRCSTATPRWCRSGMDTYGSRVARGRRRRDAPRGREGAREGADARRPPAGVQRGRPRVRRRRLHRQGHRQVREHQGARVRGVDRPRPARRDGARPRRRRTSTTRRTSRGRSAPTSAWSRSTPRPAASTSSSTSPSTTAASHQPARSSRARCTAASPRASPRRCSRRPSTTRRATSSTAR